MSHRRLAGAWLYTIRRRLRTHSLTLVFPPVDPTSPGSPPSPDIRLAPLPHIRLLPESVQDRLSPELITAFQVAGTRVSGVALQPGHRLAYIALREGLGPFEPRSRESALRFRL